MKEKVIIVGTSGHSKVVCDVILAVGRFEVLGFIDDYLSNDDSDLNILGKVEDIPEIINKYDVTNFIVAIGHNYFREKVVSRMLLQNKFIKFISSVHPSAIIGSDVVIEDGVVIMPNVVVNSNTIIGVHSILNTGSIAEHDCVLSDFSSLAPNSVISGNVSVGKGSSISVGACVINKINIGEGTIIGAGAVVVKDVGDYKLVIGVPGKSIRDRKVDEHYI